METTITSTDQGSRSKIIFLISRFAKDPLGLFGLILVIIMVLSAVFASWIMPYDPIALDILHSLEPPSMSHIMGTDQLGRDVFSRVLMGGRIALKVALVSISLALSFGLILGLIAGYGPPWMDRLMIIFFDTIRSFPTIIFALAVVTLVGPSMNTVILVVIITTIPVYGRIVRAQAQSMKNNEFILAERSMGAGMPRILFVHIFPNIVGPLLIIASMDIPAVVTLEAGLSFLGVGIRPPASSWGTILNDGYSFIRNTPWLIISAGIPLIMTTLGFTFLGESLRDIFDPKLRKDI
jgi:peptide/nickel transport system permease protein